MRTLKDSNKRKLVTAVIGGVLCLWSYKLYLYLHDRQQFEDSNLLVSLVFAGAAAAFIYVILQLISTTGSSK